MKANKIFSLAQFSTLFGDCLLVLGKYRFPSLRAPRSNPYSPGLSWIASFHSQ